MNSKLFGKILGAGILEIRDVEKGNSPFLYASGNWGPGYVTIKSLVSDRPLLKVLVRLLARKIATVEEREISFVAGNVTGGMIPGWLLAGELRDWYGRDTPFFYVRNTRKKGGQKELVTGLLGRIGPWSRGIVVEELVNFAQTTCNSVVAVRDERGSIVKDAACILFYDNPVAKESLAKLGVEMTYLFTLRDLLLGALKFKTHPERLVKEYLRFLDDPLAWQAERGLEPVKGGGTE